MGKRKGESCCKRTGYRVIDAKAPRCADTKVVDAYPINAMTQTIYWFQRLLRGGLLLMAGFSASLGYAIGTDAGAQVENTASASFAISGAVQPPVTSNTTQTVVDELIDVVVVSNDGGVVGVASPETGAVLQFTVTNNGNGSEVFRILPDDGVAEGGFDPVINQLYIESNGVPGLQPGADTSYVPGISDPELAEDEVITIYVEANIPAALAQGDNGDVELRAISETIRTQAGTDDPDDVAWPTPGTSYAGLGTNGGDVVVGNSHDIANLLVRTTGRYQINSAVVTLTKTVDSVLDPFGGTTVVPGSVITYRLELSVSGVGTAENLVVSDPIPAQLDYQIGTLQVDGLAEDDDFAPLGTDNSGFDSGTGSVVVDRGSVAGGSPTVVITFDAAVL